MTTTILDALEAMARHHCDARKVTRDYNGQVAGTDVTDSGAISVNAEALQILAAANPRRFRIIAQSGRMVVGYWPENDPVVLSGEDKPRSTEVTINTNTVQSRTWMERTANGYQGMQHTRVVTRDGRTVCDQIAPTGLVAGWV